VTEREQADLIETRKAVYARERGICETCGKHLKWGEFELAHRIPQNKTMLRIYGPEVVHHPRNLALTCKNAACNDGVSISNHPIEIAEMVREIREGLNR